MSICPSPPNAGPSQEIQAKQLCTTRVTAAVSHPEPQDSVANRAPCSSVQPTTHVLHHGLHADRDVPHEPVSPGLPVLGLVKLPNDRQGRRRRCCCASLRGVWPDVQQPLVNLHRRVTGSAEAASNTNAVPCQRIRAPLETAPLADSLCRRGAWCCCYSRAFKQPNPA